MRPTVESISRFVVPCSLSRFHCFALSSPTLLFSGFVTSILYRLMTHALAVASFPDHPVTPHQPDGISSGTRAAKEKRSRHRKATLVLKPVSVGRDFEAAQAYDNDVAAHDPYSPIVFSSQPSIFVDQLDDRSVSSSSPSRRLASLPNGTAHADSTKASIAALGLSRRTPSPSYDLLTASSALDPQRGYWDQHIPPRSSSLPLYHPDSSHAMLRASSSTSVDSDRCSSRMVFAERSSTDAPYGSSAFARSPSKLSPTSPLRSDGSSAKSSLSRPTSTSSSLRSSQSSHSRKANSQYHDDDMTPYGLMMASGAVAPGLAFSILPACPTPPIPKRSAQAKPPASAPTPSPEPQGCSSTASSIRLGLQKMKRLATRRSISSLDFLHTQSDGTRSEDRSPSSLATLSVDGRSMESVVSSEIATPAGDEPGEAERRMAVAKVVGDVWEPQDLNQVIPALRSLKVSGKIGH